MALAREGEPRSVVRTHDVAITGRRRARTASINTGKSQSTGHHRDTIGRLFEDLAEHGEELNEYCIHDVGLIPVERDELWTTIKRNRRRLSVKPLLGLKRVMRGSTPRVK